MIDFPLTIIAAIVDVARDLNNQMKHLQADESRLWKFKVQLCSETIDLFSSEATEFKASVFNA